MKRNLILMGRKEDSILLRLLVLKIIKMSVLPNLICRSEDLHPKYMRLLKSNNKKRNNIIQKWAKYLNRHLTKDDTQIVNKLMKWFSTLFVISEFQIKTIIRYHYIPIRVAKIQNTDNSKCLQGCGATGTLIHCCKEHKMLHSLFNLFEKELGNSLESYKWVYY